MYPVSCVLNLPMSAWKVTPEPCLPRDSAAASTGFLRSWLEPVAVEGLQSWLYRVGAEDQAALSRSWSA